MNKATEVVGVLDSLARFSLDDQEGPALEQCSTEWIEAALHGNGVEYYRSPEKDLDQRCRLTHC